MNLRKVGLVFTPKTTLILALLITGVIMLISLRHTGKTFLKYGDKDMYKPLNDESGRGLIGKINRLLKEALTDTTAAESVFAKYSRLEVIAPVDDSFATFKDTRLVKFTPKNRQESDFYFNSQFSKLIEKQGKDLSEEYFKIIYSHDHKHIRSIVVDEIKLFTTLSNNAWKGMITFHDPTLDWDSNRKFIVCEKQVVPMFTCANDTLSQHNVSIGDAVDFLAPENILKSFWENPHSLSINVTGKLDFNIWQNRNLLVVSLNDTTGKIVYAGNEFKKRKVFDNRLIKNRLFFTIKRGAVEIPVTISDKSPYMIASQVANGAYAGNKIEIDSSYSDLFSAQIINNIRQSLRSSDTINELRLSYDAVQAKYYEKIFRDSLVHSFQKRFGYQESTNYDINLTLMDISSGEIIAAPFYNNNFQKCSPDELLFKTNYNLKSSYEIGSTFKPVLAAASVLNYPALISYQFKSPLSYASIDVDKKIYDINGYDIKWSMKKPGDYFKECDNMGSFLAKSEDGYPMGLVMNAFVGKNDNTVFAGMFHDHVTYDLKNIHSPQFLDYKGNELFIKNIQNTYLCKTIDYVFGIPVTRRKDENKYFLQGSNLEPFQMLPENSSLFGTDIEGLNEIGELNFDRDLRPWILGQGMVDISLYSLCQAYARILSKRAVSLNYVTVHPAVNDLIYNDNQLPNYMAFENNRDKLGKRDIWNRFIMAWLGGQHLQGATFEEGITRFEKSRASFPGNLTNKGTLNVFFKTGTPSNTVDSMFFRSLVNYDRHLKLGKDDAYFIMAVTNSVDQLQNDNAKGIVLAVHVSRKKVLHSPAEAKAFKALSGFMGADLIKNFLTEDLIKNIIRFNQQRFQ